MLRRLVFLFLLASTAPAGAAEPLVADLSRHLVAITTGFAGTDVLLFGAVAGEGDVVVVVRGPARTETVRRKQRRGGIWINSGHAEIAGAPAFYRVAATRPLAEVAPPALLQSHAIGLEHLDLDIRPADSSAEPHEYRAALVRLKQRAGLYGDHVQDIGFLGQRLFRADMHFPANVPTGTYLVEVYYLVDGRLAGTQTTPLVVSKIGLGAQLHDFAHRRAAAYGVAAVLLAAGGGWLAAASFRR
ncbi:TIGR02186 family protein [Magnetospirillum sp. UT-4]|uniref:TIGR02186 family protein n=1 Tax=Magnetospirillum sp. UT-4 TaxID=2681467 RepID=UPI001384C13F|nr:TIGR02186 family protein [Magnetospirillum sp. UT-4]CAA7616329.1 conserved exported hypothetical protein [Magnetospirillum sp. UT-4]